MTFKRRKEISRIFSQSWNRFCYDLNQFLSISWPVSSLSVAHTLHCRTLTSTLPLSDFTLPPSLSPLSRSSLSPSHVTVSSANSACGCSFTLASRSPLTLSCSSSLFLRSSLGRSLSDYLTLWLLSKFPFSLSQSPTPSLPLPSISHSPTRSLSLSLSFSLFHSLTLSLSHSLTLSLSHSLTLSLSHSHALALSLSLSLSHSITLSLSLSLYHSLTLSLSHSLKQLYLSLSLSLKLLLLNSVGAAWFRGGSWRTQHGRISSYQNENGK